MEYKNSDKMVVGRTCVFLWHQWVVTAGHICRSMLERAGDAILWGFLIGTLLERSHWVRLVKDYSKVVLFADNLAKEHDVQELVCLRSTLWGYFKALASVVAQHREGCEDNITSRILAPTCKFSLHFFRLAELQSFLQVLNTRQPAKPLGEIAWITWNS